MSTKPGQAIQEDVICKMYAHQERMEVSMNACQEATKACLEDTKANPEKMKAAVDVF
jgi:hypothetical protein